MSLTRLDLDSIQPTSDRMTGRAGLAPFAQYITSLGLADNLAQLFPNIKKNNKGVSAKDFFKSILCWFMDGTSRHINSLDELFKDDTIKAIFDVKDIPSSHAAKRMFSNIGHNDELKLRKVLMDLFLRQLKAQSPKIVWLGVDSMVLDNDDAEKRMGVEPTYKKVKGFHPLQMTWNGMITDAVFRRGSRSTHEFKLTKSMIGRAVCKVRELLGNDVAIIVSLDAGYFDEKLLKYLDEDIKVGFMVGGKIYQSLKDDMLSIPDDNWLEYSREKSSWRYTEIGFKCNSWSKYYRAIFSQVQSRKDGQMLLDFARPSNLFVTNIGMRKDLFAEHSREIIEAYTTVEALLLAYQHRGAEELCHRGLKDFGCEQLPFKRHGSNLGFYHLMVIAFAAFENFKRECLQDVVAVGSYASTVRRTFIDIAGKLTTTHRKLCLKLRENVLNRLKFKVVWQRCCLALPLTS